MNAVIFVMRLPAHEHICVCVCLWHTHALIIRAYKKSQHVPYCSMNTLNAALVLIMHAKPDNREQRDNNTERIPMEILCTSYITL